MGFIDPNDGHRCDSCGSDRMGYMCNGCREMACSCEPCQTCNDIESSQSEYDSEDEDYHDVRNWEY